jgi:RNA polymerase sigma factor (sigma-70 family)
MRSPSCSSGTVHWSSGLPAASCATRSKQRIPCSRCSLIYFARWRNLTLQGALFKVWLLMYAYHGALNHLRSLRAARYYEFEDLEEGLRNYTNVEKKRPYPFQATEAAHLIREALEQIQPRQRQVIELVYYEGYTAEEIAERIGDSAHSVRHNLYLGMKKAHSILTNVGNQK